MYKQIIIIITKNALFVRILPDLKQSCSKWLKDFEMTINVMANTASVKRAHNKMNKCCLLLL